jgi:hypothetical protein
LNDEEIAIKKADIADCYFANNKNPLFKEHTAKVFLEMKIC